MKSQHNGVSLRLPAKSIAGVGFLAIWLLLSFFAFFVLAYTGESKLQVYKLAADPTALVSELEAAYERSQFSAAPYHLVHFSDPQCECDADANTHLASLKHNFPDLKIWRQESLREADSTLWPRLDQVPAAALYDHQGNLVYFGPYSSGPTCGSGFNFVEQLLASMPNHQSAPRPSVWVNELALGCFCSLQV